MHTPSPQQAAVYAWVKSGKGSALMPAVAGAGKTTTLIEAVALMQGSVAFAAYNKKIADEIQARLTAKGVGTNVRAGTFHSFGFQAWQRAVGKKVRVDAKKLNQLQEELRHPEWSHEFVRKAVSLAKQRGIGALTLFDDAVEWHYLVDHFDLEDVLTKDAKDLGALELDAKVEEGLVLAKALLRRSVEVDRDVIDFDDMLYCPLFHECKMWQNDWVLIDEAQDTNPVRRAMAKKMLRPGGRLLAVGDPHQAIYGFTGADNDSLELIRKEFACIELPLTVTYRCPQAVVAVAHQWVQHIQAHESAPMGEVRSLTDMEFEQLPAAQLDASSAVLCRNTKPLVAAAYAMIRRGIGCRVEGRDIGQGLLALANRWKVRTLDALSDKLDEYLTKQVATLMAKGQELKAEQLTDRVETLQVILGTLPGHGTLADLRSAVDKLFGDTEAGQAPRVLTLSTVHKSKGREWDRVYLLGRNKYMPSRFARQQWQLEQEYNLMYVAVTRAKRELVEIVVNGKPAK